MKANARRGFALLATLWLLVLLSLVGLEVGVQARYRRLGAANLVDNVTGNAAAMAGIAYAMSRLDAISSGVFPTDAAWTPSPPLSSIDPWGSIELFFGDTVRVDDTRFLIEAHDSGSRLHLNVATEDELRRFFAALRMDHGKADRLAQSIMDWRDVDQSRRARGAEREHYLAAGSPVLPADGPFQRLSDLRFVDGMSTAEYELIIPHLTLTGSGRVNLRNAPREVLLSLPGIEEEAAEIIMRLRADEVGLSNLDALSNYLSAGARAEFIVELARLRSRVTLETTEVEVISTGWLDGSSSPTVVRALVTRESGSARLAMLSRS